jgi:hypothetical protein
MYSFNREIESAISIPAIRGDATTLVIVFGIRAASSVTGSYSAESIYEIEFGLQFGTAR